MRGTRFRVSCDNHLHFDFAGAVDCAIGRLRRKVRLHCVDGRETRTKSPAVDDFAAWEKRLRLILKEAENREAKGGLRPEESVYGALRIHAYRYLRRLKRAHLQQALKNYLLAREPGRWHRHAGDEADWVLRLLEEPGKAWLTPPRRSRIALELRFADWCGVHSRWLLPLLYEAGNQRLIKAALKASHPPNWTSKYRRLLNQTSNS